MVLPCLRVASGAIQSAPVSTSAARFASHGPHEEVGPYPRTKEELERAAKKYNLIPEDYKPFPEDEGFGDYPDLPAVGAYNRDWYDDFDDPETMRDYGEPLHVLHDRYYWEREDPLAHTKYKPSHWITLPIFLGCFFVMPFFYWLFDRYKIQINHNFKKRLNHPLGQKYYQFPVSASSSSHH